MLSEWEDRSHQQPSNMGREKNKHDKKIAYSTEMWNLVEIFAKVAIHLLKMICWVELSLKFNQIKFPILLICWHIFFVSFLNISSHWTIPIYAVSSFFFPLLHCWKPYNNEMIKWKIMAKSYFAHNSCNMINMMLLLNNVQLWAR